MFILLNIFWLLVISYAVFVLILWLFWNRIQVYTMAQPADLSTRVTVVIPVRNEENNILALLGDLTMQDYPKNLFEVMVVDDASEDNTVQLTESFIENADINIKLIRMGNKTSSSPKKAAIEAAIAKSEGDFIITTDGDCRVDRGWISCYISMYEQTNAKLISGPVTFTAEQQFTDYLQTVEFSSLIGTGAACIQAGSPTMCNGANLGYRKEAFLTVNGFEGVRHIASGDDEFLMQKIRQKFPDGIRFLKHHQAIVKTHAHQTWKGFFNQRKRWASKWQHYDSIIPRLMAVYVFLSNAVLPVSFLATLAGFIHPNITLALWLLKCLPEWLFISTVLRFLGKENSILFIPLVQIVYPLYIFLFGLSGSSKGYLWKDRELQ